MEKKMKQKAFFWCCGLGTILSLAGCGGTGSEAETFVRSDYYTRGIGVYPGNPKEDFSPELLPDKDTYRNLAWMRATKQSSSYDYNLTSQLATDGIISEEQPRYLILSTADGIKPKREREWMIDGGPYSRNEVLGEDTYFQFSLKNYSETYLVILVVDSHSRPEMELKHSLPPVEEMEIEDEEDLDKA